MISIFSEKKSYGVYFLKTHKVNRDDLQDLMSAEAIIDENLAPMPGMVGGPEQKLRPNQADRILRSYTENLNQKYFDKKIDPVIGRDSETDVLKQILARRNKNNVLLVASPSGRYICLETIIEITANNAAPNEEITRTFLLSYISDNLPIGN